MFPKKFVFLIIITIVPLLRTDETTEVINIETSSFETTTNNENNTENSTFDSVLTTTEIENSTCDNVDGNCSISTKTFIKTTRKPNVTTTIKPTGKHGVSTASPDKLCSCDHHAELCDINCCCDVDCSYDQRQIFDRCEDDVYRFYDTSFCEYTKFVHKNNTPYEWTVNQNGLFCIAKTNLPPKFVFHQDITLSNMKDAELQKYNKFSWASQHFDITSRISNVTFEFLYGEYIWIIKEKTIQQLQMLDGTHTDACSNMKPVQLLQDAETQCNQYDINENNTFLRLDAYTANVSIVSMSPPSKYFNQKRLNSLGYCPKDVCIIYDVKTCNEFLENCTRIGTKTNTAFTCYRHNKTKICLNLVKKLQYRIYHNGTQGIKKIEMLANLTNKTFTDENTMFTQSFQVRFLWSNHSYNFSSQRSGNPGYILGKPVLIGNLDVSQVILKKPTNFTTLVSIKRNYYDFTENFMVVPANKRGNCVLTNTTNTNIVFGYNMVMNCQLKEVLEITKNKSSDMCQEIQRYILKLWSLKVDNSTKLFGKFGNANPRNFNHWGNISFPTTPKDVLNQVTSIFTLNKSELNCANIYTMLKIDIFHARTVVKDLHDQEKILWITFEFKRRRNFTFSKTYSAIQLDVPLRSEVVFYDITTKKIIKFADPPSLDIKLPYDFFYPFVKIDSYSITHEPWTYVMYLILAYMLCIL